MSTLNFIKPDNTDNANDDEYDFGSRMSSEKTAVEGDCDSGMLSQVPLESSKWSGSEVIHQLWSHLRTERRHRTLLYYRLNSCSCWMEDLLASSNVSTMVWDDHEYPHYLRHHQDLDLLGVVCLKTSQYREVLNALKVMLNQMRNVPVIVQLCESDDGVEEEVSAKNILQLSLEYSQILDLVRNNTVDIAASLRPYTSVHSNLHRFSYAGMVGSWCTMLPMERTLSSQEALGRLMQTPWSWLYLLLLYGAHSVLAQRKLLRTRLFSIVKPMTHLLLLCILLGQLSALFIAPQQLNHIKNIREMEQAGVRIMGIRAEFPEYPFDLRSRYATSFLLKDGLSEVATHRNGFNTTYAYTVTSVKWLFYNEAQSYFRHPLFRYSEDICVQKLSIFALILRENCLYHDRLGVFILRLHAAGLLRFWYRRSFFEMVEAGSIRLEDKSQPHHYQPISWPDWQYVLIIYGVALTTSLTVFFIELAVYHVNVWLDNL
ncbi:uncharacterized protein Ir94f [Drosophila bipectinata]|uniref:uncharacterized protein Ir94f n=1 Tax=Drosophila bipectinata TaxID=42026 RepID=UPI0038B28E8D